jgi:hypothetical protein
MIPLIFFKIIRKVPHKKNKSRQSGESLPDFDYLCILEFS